jgi:hypothetical protein
MEISASVGFIHKESVTMHGHTIVKITGKRIFNTVGLVTLARLKRLQLFGLKTKNTNPMKQSRWEADSRLPHHLLPLITLTALAES